MTVDTYTIFNETTGTGVAHRWDSVETAQEYINNEHEGSADWAVRPAEMYTDNDAPPRPFHAVCDCLVGSVWAEAKYWRQRAEKAESTTKDLRVQWEALRQDFGLGRCTS